MNNIIKNINKKDKKMIISFIINIVISILTLNAIIMSIMGIKFMYGGEPYPELIGVPIYSYYTIQSNVFMGIVSFIFAIKEYQLLRGRKKEIPLTYYIFKMTATIAVSLTFFVVFAIFGFLSRGGHIPLLRNSYLFFHLIIPIISILNFILFEKTNKIKFKYIFYGLLPTILYEIYYTVNLLMNMKNGTVSIRNDWYSFAQNGLFRTILVVPMMLGITFGLSLLIWKLNKNNE
ncbi:MAG: hypothetical protein IKE70_02530 [Bacilli bacterium]|nr:hypothetical protein [Bacilli bacterium]